MTQTRCLHCLEVADFCCGRFGRTWIALPCQCGAKQFVSGCGHLFCEGTDCPNAFGTWSAAADRL